MDSSGTGAVNIQDAVINIAFITGAAAAAGNDGSSGSSGTSGVINISNSGDNRVLTDIDGDNANAEQNLTFVSDGGSDGNGFLTVTGDVLITHDLTVDGTASFRNTENLLVKDRFILLASGSTTVGDGGLVVQQTTQDKGEGFFFDAGTTRWGFSGSLDADDGSAAFAPDAFVSSVVVGGSAADTTANVALRYVAKGNIFVSSSQDIFIYS